MQSARLFLPLLVLAVAVSCWHTVNATLVSPVLLPSHASIMTCDPQKVGMLSTPSYAVKLCGNSTHGALFYYEKYPNGTLKYQAPYIAVGAMAVGHQLYNCFDIAAMPGGAILVSCAQYNWDNNQQYMDARIMSMSATVPGQIVSASRITDGNAGSGILAIFGGSGVNSTFYGTFGTAVRINYANNLADGSVSGSPTFIQGPVASLTVTALYPFGVINFICWHDAGWFSYDGVSTDPRTTIGIRCVNRNTASGALSSLASFDYPTMKGAGMHPGASFLTLIDNVGLRIVQVTLSGGAAVFATQSANITLPMTNVNYYRRMWVPPVTGRGVYFLANNVLKYAKINSLVPSGLATISSFGQNVSSIDFERYETYAYASTPTAAIQYTVDESTIPATFVNPAASSVINGAIPISFTLGEAALSNLVTVSFAGSSSLTLTFTLAGLSCVASITTASIVAPVSGTGCTMTATTASALGDGLYTVSVTYQDTYGNLASSVSHSSVSVDATTQAPTATLPAASTAYRRSSVPFAFTIPELGAAMSIFFKYSNGTTQFVLVGGASGYTAGAHSFTADLSSSAAAATTSSNQFTSISGLLIDGTYNAVVSYQDRYSNPPATTTLSAVTIDSITKPITITSPLSGAILNNPVVLTFTLGEIGLVGSVKCYFINALRSYNLVLTYSTGSGLSQTKSFDPSNPIASASVFTITPSGGILPGVYVLSLEYQDSLGNPAASASVNSVVVAPYGGIVTATSPMTGASYSFSVIVSFGLKYSFYPAGGLFDVVFTNTHGYTFTMHFRANNATDTIFTATYVTIQTAAQMTQNGVTLLSMSPDRPLPSAHSGTAFDVTLKLNASVLGTAQTFPQTQVLATGVTITSASATNCTDTLEIPIYIQTQNVTVVYEQVNQTVTVYDRTYHTVVEYRNTTTLEVKPCPVNSCPVCPTCPTCSTCDTCDICEICEVCPTPTTVTVSSSCSDFPLIAIIVTAVLGTMSVTAASVAWYYKRKNPYNPV